MVYLFLNMIWSELESMIEGFITNSDIVCIALSKCADDILKYKDGEVNIDSDVIKTHAFAPATS
ncbi:MAG: hypothetical protein Q6363_008955 [Candidatus Njordarchaeota archaeon]